MTATTDCEPNRLAISSCYSSSANLIAQKQGTFFRQFLDGPRSISAKYHVDGEPGIDVTQLREKPKCFQTDV
jgi:hypothetical protein